MILKVELGEHQDDNLSTLNILCGLAELPSNGVWKLTIDILDINPIDLPIFKVSVNGKSWKFEIPAVNENCQIDREIPDSS